ncbi:MAG: flagellar motor protein PomA [Natronospirillum sp.]|uniref:flagellar motor protein PomA n=1 Tax=Natronospirillum sp. TaxID=2812955 RepID=UPI0025EB9ED4|nr:flagellar motor protein PomA [Natronospirillum sp.]MCH8550579.1 flagellar motor protein PomA [Natronospirillum sp.]
MDLATIVGLIGGIGMIIMAMIIGGDPIVYYNLPSVLIVLVGSLFVTMQKFNLEQFLGALKIAGKAYSYKSVTQEEIIEEVVELADAARKGGLLSLEGKEVSHEFLGKGIQLLVDGHDPDVVRTLLNRDIRLTRERHEQGAGIFAALGDVAPAMGMIGTLIGLVGMLAVLDDPRAIGPQMAVALLTTMYGSILATVIAIPIKDKCMLRSDEETMIQQMIRDALLGIQAGQNPRIIEQALKTYLPAGQRGAD